ncbi:hypothetical protein Tco_0239236, partial [Tanacetum coccineum]
ANDVDVYDINPEFVPTPKGHKYCVPDVPYTAKARFGVRKSGIKRHKGKITHRYVWCNKFSKPRKTVKTNTLNEDANLEGKEDENEEGNRKRKRKSSSTLTNRKARIGLKAILGTNSYKVIDFVENPNH